MRWSHLPTHPCVLGLVNEPFARDVALILSRAGKLQSIFFSSVALSRESHHSKNKITSKLTLHHLLYLFKTFIEEVFVYWILDS